MVSPSQAAAVVSPSNKSAVSVKSAGQYQSKLSEKRIQKLL